ncbi:hypothetical protein [Megalodesulfovibrio gigas]|uniref:Transmembrane protein n=1 Tax=Megalodesulfovibrio gigas (strain ATCC 19364 / DSM 1382 / NCIMB 9332 / VKM B-1759) TaxID=1121448 RepID=T2GBE1_MEGG1|nr:hypothetical protein [Megalodesulfovibrio gigas]AGW13588.1 hypothetical protein DGI_1789 [Megalodesulfovibrio gigas DSM 1382 = ATCC 19364]
MAPSHAKELRKLCAALRQRADSLALLDPQTLDAAGVQALRDDLTGLAEQTEDAAGLSARAKRRALLDGLQRTLLAGAIFAAILVLNAKVFHEHSLVTTTDVAKLVRGVMPADTDFNYYAQLLQWAMAASFSLLLFLLALMVATLMEGVLRLVRFPWLNAVFFSLLTLICSGAGLWAYLYYVPNLKNVLYEFFR